MKKICIIAVNHKNFKITIDMYRSVKITNFDFDFIAVDNSLDVNEKFALLEFSKTAENFKALILGENEGYFSAINAGLSFVENSSYDFVIVGNNDLIFDCSFFDVLVSKGYHDDVYCVCPDVCTIDGFHQNPHVTNRFSFFRLLKMDIYYSNFIVAKFLSYFNNLFFPRKANVKNNMQGVIHMGIGAVYVLTRSFFLKNNLLYFPYFLYGEEAFLSNQIHTTNGILLYDPDLIVTHLESATLSSLPNKRKYILSKESYKEYRCFL